MERSSALPSQPATRPTPAFHRRIATADLAFVGLCVVAVAVILYAARYGTFFNDEWGFIDGRSDWSLGALMQPWNEHWALVPGLVYNILFSTFGLRSYLPFLAVLMAAHVAAASAVYTLLRIQNGALPALGGTAVLLMLGTGYQNLMWAFQIGFVGAAAAGAWALVLTFVRPTATRSVVAAGLLVVAVATQGVGLFFVAGITAALLVDSERRHRLWVVAPAAVASGLWYATLGGAGIGWQQDPFTLDVLRLLPDYVLTGTSNAIGMLTGLGQQVGLVVFVGIAGATAWHLSGNAPIRWAAVAGFAGLLAQFTLTGIVRDQFGVGQATESRYVYVAAILLLIITSGWIGRRFATFNLRSTGVLALIVMAALGTNLIALRDGSRVFQDYWVHTRAALTVIDRYGGSPAVSDDETIFPLIGQRRLSEIRSTLGWSLDDAILPEAPPPSPTLIDAQLYRLVSEYFVADVQPSMPIAVERPRVEQSSDVRVSTDSGCVSVRGTGIDPQIEILVNGGLAIATVTDRDGDAQAFVALFGPFVEERSHRFAMRAGVAYTIRAPDIGEERPWKLRLDPPADGQTTRICIVDGTSAPPGN